MRRKIKSFLGAAVFVAVAILAILSGCDQRSKKVVPSLKPIKIVGMPTGFYLPLFVAIDQKFFEEEGYAPEITLLNSASETMTALVRGDADLGGFGSGNVFAMESKRPGTLAMLYCQYNRSYSLVKPKGSPISSLEDLRGKRIGTWPGPTSTLCVQSLLNPRLGADGYTIVPIEHRFMGLTLSKKDVDAVFSTDVYTAQMVEQGIGEVFDATPMPTHVFSPFFNGGAAVLRTRLKTDPEFVARLDRVMAKTLAFINAHNADARKSLVTHLKVSEDVAVRVPLDDFIPVDQVDISRSQEVSDAFFAAKAIDTPVSISKLLSRDDPR